MSLSSKKPRLQRYGDLVWSLARRSCSDVHAAEDAVQDIFLRLWKVADRYDPSIGSESTFIAMIARRRLIDLKRKRTLQVTGAMELDSLSNPEMDAGQRIALNDEAAKATKLLDQLPVAQRQVIKLSVYDGLSHSRIAESTGLSLGTVKTHIRRGMLKLRDALCPTADQQQVYSEPQSGESS